MALMMRVPVAAAGTVVVAAAVVCPLSKEGESEVMMIDQIL